MSTRPLEIDDDDDNDPSHPQAKRAQVDSGGTNASLNGDGEHESQDEHYDIYCLPCWLSPFGCGIVPLSTPFQPAAAGPGAAGGYKSLDLVVVNSRSGLRGFGRRYGLAGSTEHGVLGQVADPGFVIPRETAWDPSNAVYLGWVSIDALPAFESLIATVPVPPLQPTQDPNEVGAREVKDWVLEVGRKLEMEGVLANPEILLSDLVR